MDILEYKIPWQHPPPVLDIEVPLLTVPSTDDGPFVSFPIRRGFSMHEHNGFAELAFPENHTYEEYTDLLQSWLYFKLVQEIWSALHVVIGVSDFVRILSRGHKVLTAQRPVNDLESTLKRRRRWFNRIGSALLSRNFRGTFDRETVQQAILTAQHNAIIYDFEDGHSSVSTKRRASVILSVRYLIWEVTDIFTRHHLLQSKEVESIRFQRLVPADGREQIPASAMISKEFLRSKGWCPAMAVDLLSRENLDHIYSAAALVRCRNDVNHDLCSATAGCVAFNVDAKNFQAKHREKTCKCSFVQPKMKKIYSILEQGAIPIAELSQDGYAHIHLRVIPLDFNEKYAAISHVWADGLCSSSRNGLFYCNLKKLFKSVHNTSELSRRTPRVGTNGEGYADEYLDSVDRRCIRVWIDALCIPVHDHQNPGRSEAFKQQAINSMSKIYAGATTVLVLDHGLDQIHRLQSDGTCVDMSYSIRYSAWMNRCWTLLEGALARSLYFQCKNEVIAKPKQLWSHNEVEDPLFIIETLLSRSTSMKADMDQIFATLTRFDAKELMSYSEDDRAKAIIRSMGDKMPVNLLLRPLNEDTLRQKPRDEWWVPDLKCRASLYTTGRGSARATVCPKGLKLQTWRQSIWDGEGFPIEPLRIRDATQLRDTFWLEHGTHKYWVIMDIKPDLFCERSNPFKESFITLILPCNTTNSCQNARGFIGRGLCLTNTNNSQITMYEYDSPDPCKAWSTLFNCAFSIGIQTPLSSSEFPDIPTITTSDIGLYPEDADGRIFLIESDIDSWPRLEVVRDGKEDVDIKHKHIRDVDRIYWLTRACLQCSLICACGFILLCDIKINLVRKESDYIRTMPYIRANSSCSKAIHVLILIPFPLLIVLFIRTLIRHHRQLKSKEQDIQRWVASFAQSD